MALKSVENRLERSSKRRSPYFQSTLQPIEIGTRIVRGSGPHAPSLEPGSHLAESDSGVARTVDAARFERLPKALVVSSKSRTTARVSEGFSFVGPVKVEIFIDDDIKPGNLEVKTSSWVREPALD